MSTFFRKRIPVFLWLGVIVALIAGSGLYSESLRRDYLESGLLIPVFLAFGIGLAAGAVLLRAPLWQRKRRLEEDSQEEFRELEETNRLLQSSYEEQEKIAYELLRSQEMYLKLIDNASDAIVISDDEDRIMLFNRRAEEFFGVDNDRVIGQNLFRAVELVSGNTEEQYGLYRELLEKGKHEAELSYIRLHDGQPIVGWLRGSVVRDRQGKFWVQTIIRDVTREREAKENLARSARELERLNQMKDSFLGIVSHELKTPLTVIVGYADLILSATNGTADEKFLGMVRPIAQAAERLTEIVQDMVDVSLLDSQKLSFIQQITDLNQLIREIFAERRESFAMRRQRSEIKLAADLPPIFCDPCRLRQAIGHLLGNAIKFTPDCGTITIETRAADFNPVGEPSSSSPGVEIILRDTGIGISEFDRRHIFDKFFETGHIEEHFTGKVAFRGKGTGLGLTLAKGILDLHGGRIWLESPGYDPQGCPGTTFHVLLPAAGESAETPDFSCRPG